MSGPTSPARDSSLRDRKAPGVCIRQTPQPRSTNVMVRSTIGHPRRSILRLDTRVAPLARLASRKGRKECGDVLDWKLVFAPNCDHVRHPVDAKCPELLPECAIAADIEAVPVSSALPAQHRST